MKRFITYLYEYDHGNKTKNVGFIRVDIRDLIVNIEVCIKNYIRDVEEGKIYVLIPKETFMGIELGKIKLCDGQYTIKFTFDKNNLVDSGHTMQDVVGVAVCFENNEYLASCWDDEWAEEIARGGFSIYTKDEISMEEQRKEECCESYSKDVNMQQLPEISECTTLENRLDHKIEKDITYKKIELNQIRDLPSSNWHLCNNRFLLHGVVNYGYLFLKKEKGKNDEKLWLGVPGYYEKPELFMALLFGFTEFAAVPKMIVDMELNKEREINHSEINPIETNQEQKTGIFGGWFVLLGQ